MIGEGRPAQGELSLLKYPPSLAQDTKHRAFWVAASGKQRLSTQPVSAALSGGGAAIPDAFWCSMSAALWP